MWPFEAKPSVKALDERLTTLERGFKALELEWDDTYDKLRRAMGRVVKSRAIMERQEEADAPTPAATNGNDQTSRGRLLTARQMELQQKILQRRAGG